MELDSTTIIPREALAAGIYHGYKGINEAADGRYGDGAAYALLGGLEILSARGLKPGANSAEATVVINKRMGTAREQLVGVELQQQYPGASVQAEQLLRTNDGLRAVDPLTGTARRIDHVVIENGAAIDSVETTSLTASKAAQIAKENRIRQMGGTFIRDREAGQLVDLSAVQTRIVRKK